MEEREQTLATAASMIEQVGYRATIDDDGDIAFKIEGVRGYLRIYADDPHCAFVWMRFSLPPETDIAKATRIANRLTAETKGIKTTVDRQNPAFTVSYDCFFDEIEHLRRPMARILHALVSADSTFAHQLSLPETALESPATA